MKEVIMKMTKNRVEREERIGTRGLTLVKERFLMEANWKITRIRVEKGIRIGTRALTLVEGRFLMEANMKTTKRRVKKEIRRTGTRAAGQEVISKQHLKLEITTTTNIWMKTDLWKWSQHCIEDWRRARVS